MAGFKTHVTTSTILGLGYGGAALWLYDVPLPRCIMAAGLCSVSGMLPDLDSDSGTPLRESIAFAAAVVPMLLMERWKQFGWSHESMVLAGGMVYLLIRFGLSKLLKKFTVHRGMYHSLPAALIAGQIAFLLCSSGDFMIRMYQAGAVVTGFMSHLVLDEIWSIQWARGRIRLKSSSGTAIKFWGQSGVSNLFTYVCVGLLMLLVLNDPIWIGVSPQGQEAHQIATTVLNQLRR